MLNYLVFSAMGANRPGVVDVCAKAIRDCGCNIVDSRMSVLGCEMAVMMLLSGPWDAIAKVETALARLQESLGLMTLQKRTEARETHTDLMPYAVEVVASDHPGVVYDISSFFSSRDIRIEDMHTGTYAAAHTGTPMFSLHMTVSVPTNTSIAALRGEFIEFCDHLNLDSIMEPVK